MWEERRRVQVPMLKHSQSAILWIHQSPSKKNTTTSNSTSHGKRCAIWRRFCIGSALVRVRQPICSECSAMATYLFHRSGLKHYSTIRLLTLRVKFDGIWRRTPELEHLPWTAFIRCIWKILFPIKAPFAKKNAPLPIFAFFVCFLQQNQS